LGIIVSIATFISYGFRFVFGYLSDRLQIVKPFVVLGYAISAVTKPLLYFSSSWVSVALLRGLERVGKSVRSATKDSLISAYSPKNKSGKNFGFHKTMDIAGELVGSIIAFLALYYVGQSEQVFKNIFAWTLIPSILAVLIVTFFVKDVPYKAKSKTQKIDLSQDYDLLPILFVYFGFVFFIFSDSFFILKAKVAGYDMAVVPLLVIVLNLTQTIFSYFFGLKIDRFGADRVLQISFVFGILSMIFLYFDFIVFSFVLLGLFLVSSLNAIRSYISNKAINKGSVFGFLYGGVAISGALGSLFVGEIWHRFGQNIAIDISIVGLFIVYAIYTKIAYTKNLTKK